jgi:DNA-binding CsgD family transcriptional regulator
MAPSVAFGHTPSMASALTTERVRRDIDVLAHAGLDTATFLAELDDSVRRALPHCATCVATLDPATGLLTGTYKFGHLVDRETHDDEWGLIEYGQVEPSNFIEMAMRDQAAVGVHASTGGDISRSPRLRDFMHPNFGFTDELRIIAKTGGRLWGGVCLFRGDGDVFSEVEVAFAASLSDALAAGFRSGLLSRLVDAPPPADVPGPAVIIVGADDRLSMVSVGAEARLNELIAGDRRATPSGIVAALVAGARRYAAGEAGSLPSSRVRVRTGQWFVLHASPLAGRDGATGDVVVTIEEARPPEIVPLVVAAFDLTPRERDVTQLVLQGVGTKEIAAALHLSTYTVQDHLKSVFEKADVRSRRELIARVFFDQYTPRIGAELTPAGWFAPQEPTLAHANDTEWS